MAASSLDRIPGGYRLYAALAAAARRPGLEWRASRLNQLRISGPRPEGLAADPHDLRPADPEAGRRILAGGFVFGGETLTTGPRGDPWDQASPSRRFATGLHSFGWLRDLTVHGDPGAWEALRLTLAWRRVFGRWNAFSWSPPVLERRVFNLACALHALSAPASEAEADQIAADLAQQARYLLDLPEDPARSAERAAAVAVAGTALGGATGEGLLGTALDRLGRALHATVTVDGGHASRSPQAALELYFDLSTLVEALTQRGMAAPDGMASAVARLAGAVRFFTLADGRLAAFQGGESLSPSYVAAALALEANSPGEIPTACNGYHRMDGHALQVLADTAAPAAGPWSVTACAQPLALEILAGGRRLIVNSGWSPEAPGPSALRLVDAASTASVADAACGAPLRGFESRVLGPRLRDPYSAAPPHRHGAKGGVWLEAAHDGWTGRFGLRHQRRLYLDTTADELRGEDSLEPISARSRPDGRRFIPFTVRFHLHPQVSALIARDKTSVLLKAEGEETGWWLRSDALEVTLAPSTYHQDGVARHGQQIVLRGQARLDAGAKVRWKLWSAAHDRPEQAPRDVARVDENGGSA